MRIGNKTKSVRVKKYIIDFYTVMMKTTKEETKEIANNHLQESINLMPSRMVNGDLITKKLLMDISLACE